MSVTRDPLWQELLERDAKANPRLEPRFGYCPFCARTATSVLPFGVVAWSICDTCGVTWPAGLHVLDVTLDEEQSAIALWDLSRLTVVDPGQPPSTHHERKGTDRMKTAIPITDFDPWPTARRPEVREPAPAVYEAPTWWYWFNKDTRARMFGIATAVVAECPEIQTGRRVDRASGLLSAQIQAGDPVAIKLAGELRHHSRSTHCLNELMERLMRAGGAIPVLEEQRRQIDHQLEQLRAIIGTR